MNRIEASQILKKHTNKLNRSKFNYFQLNTGYSCVLTKPLVGYKNVYTSGNSRTGIRREAIVKLLIPAGARVIIGRDNSIIINKYKNDGTVISVEMLKLRTDKAKVLSILSINNKPCKSGYSGHDSSFIYSVNRIVTPKRGFNRSYNTCAGGIHFYLTRKEAERYHR